MQRNFKLRSLTNLPNQQSLTKQRHISHCQKELNNLSLPSNSNNSPAKPAPTHSTPPQLLPSSKINTELHHLKINETNHKLILVNYENISQYQTHLKIYTDVSKTYSAVVCAFTGDNDSETFMRTASATILKGKLFAIIKAYCYYTNDTENILIVTDSVNSLQNISKIYTHQPLFKLIKQELTSFTNNSLTFFWAPCIGIKKK